MEPAPCYGQSAAESGMLVELYLAVCILRMAEFVRFGGWGGGGAHTW